MFNPFGAGWHLDRVAVRRPAARVRPGGRGDGPHGTADGGRTVEAPVVIDAVGRRAAVRPSPRRPPRHPRSADGGRRRLPARATTTGTPRRPSRRSSTGWWYTSAIPGDRRVVAFLTDGDLLPPGARSRRAVRRARGDDAARRAARRRAARSRRWWSPPATAHLDRPVGHGWIAAGDAAASFDPLSSQGILTAVLMGRAAAEARSTDPRRPSPARYRAIVDRYRTERPATYALEQRWPDSPFWRRRRPDHPSV